MDIKLTFLGAAQNVTGSRYLVETSRIRFYVDCGLFQEWHLKSRNWEPFTVPPEKTDAVLLTHAHLDHCGLLPKLVHEGFKGAIHCTRATAEIAAIVMQDAGKLQEEDAAFKAKRHKREGRKGPHPEAALYTKDDAEAATAYLRPCRFGDRIRLCDGVEASLIECGHILGAASVLVRIRQGGEERTLLFSGDVGRWDMPILRDPTQPDHADYVIMESTYGDRVHEHSQAIPARLADIINATHKAGGRVIIPSFSVERTQDLLYHLNLLLGAGKIPELPVFVDSPMAVKVTEVFRHHPELFDEETTQMIREGRPPCDFPSLRMCRSVEESKAINRLREPAIVIAGSGMCTGGRIKHHLANTISSPQNTVLFVGYQAHGTLGRQIADGAKEVRIHGKMHSVAARIERIDGFSAHAGKDELIRWISGLKEKPRHVFVTHGEPEAAKAFACALEDQLGFEASVPEYAQQVDLA